MMLVLLVLMMQLLLTLVLVLVLVLVLMRMLVLVRVLVLVGHLFALHLLELGPLVLEPNLDNANTEAGLFGQRLAHLPARLLTELERFSKCAPLVCGQYCARPLWSAPAVYSASAGQLIVRPWCRIRCRRFRAATCCWLRA